MIGVKRATILPQSPFLLFHQIREIWVERILGLMGFSLYFHFTLSNLFIFDKLLLTIYHYHYQSNPSKLLTFISPSLLMSMISYIFPSLQLYGKIRGGFHSPLPPII
jgi:hypothetical protein